MRAKGILFAIVGFVTMAGAAQGQVDTPVGEVDAAKSETIPARASKNSGPGFRVVASPIPYQVHYEFSRSVGPGRLLTVKRGQPGRFEKVYKVTGNGKTLVETRKVDPVHQLVYMGRSGFSTSRHSFTRGKVLTMSASAYDPTAGRGRSATFRTSTGLRAQYGVVAVDPRVIPLGTKLFIEGYGFALAADRGSAIKGKRIDLCYNTRSQCMQFGRRKVVVHVLK
jgi:3D (Asp-Asp-Asp) domain-containing protein